MQTRTGGAAQVPRQKRGVIGSFANMSALRRQIYNYSKGHVSYHLTTLFRDRDARSLWQLMLHLPRFHLRRIVKYFLRRNPYPLSLIMLEIAGNLVGPWTLWRSHRRVRRLGRSTPYAPMGASTGQSRYGSTYPAD